MTRFTLFIALGLALALSGAAVGQTNPDVQILAAPVGSQVVPALGLWKPPGLITMELPDDVRDWFYNTDGSCVQCSAGMVGVRGNLPAWTFLLFDTEYGRAERGGSGPDRVARYAKKRGMRLYNVTGDQTYEYMDWSIKTGRFAAIGFFGSHFQTNYGRDFGPEQWYYVCNNWGGEKVTRYNLAEFKRQHENSGKWCFIPDEPPAPPPPKIVEWWK